MILQVLLLQVLLLKEEAKVTFFKRSIRLTNELQIYSLCSQVYLKYTGLGIITYKYF